VYLSLNDIWQNTSAISFPSSKPVCFIAQLSKQLVKKSDCQEMGTFKPGGVMVLLPGISDFFPTHLVFIM
jgi:hypothetical protein